MVRQKCSGIRRSYLGGGKPWYVALFLFAVSVLSFVCVWLIEPTDEQETASYRYIREQSHEN